MITMIAMIFCMQGVLGATVMGQNSAASQIYANSLQESNETVPMASLLQQIERSFNVTFLYEQHLVADKHVHENQIDMHDDVGKGLSETLSELGFTYHQVDNDTFVILAKENSGQSGEFQEQVTGLVFDERSGEALPGVNVLIVGTDTGTTTDLDGNFELAVPSLDVTLRFSYIGYETQEIPLDGQTELEIDLQPEAIVGEELVVTGIGQQRRRKDLTGSISTVDAESIENVGTISPQFAIQGNTPGVRLTTTSGDPNEAPQIFIRGIGTWNGDSQPLYVIDGQIIEPPRAGNEDVITGHGLDTPPNLYNLLNPNDIESISILKDASAAAIYGSRAANGVVLITTKQGESIRPAVRVRTQTGISNYPTHDMLNTQQYVDLTHEMYLNSTDPSVDINEDLYGRNQATDAARLTNFSPQFDPESPYYIGDPTTYDWQNIMSRENALSQSANISVSGANDWLNYYISGGIEDREGMTIGRGLTRYSGAVNLNVDATEWMRIGVNYKHTNQESARDGANLQSLADAPPWQPLRDSNHESGYAPAIDPYRFGESWQAIKIYGQGTNNNVLAQSKLGWQNFELKRDLAQLYVEINPIESLTLRGSLNLDYTVQDRGSLSLTSEEIFSPQGQDQSEDPDAPNSVGSLSHRINNIFNYQSDFTATYQAIFAENHNVSLTASVQDQRHTREVQDFSGGNLQNIPYDPKFAGYGNDTPNNNSFTGISRRYWFGMVGRASYNYDSKYYLDISYRRDASNGFDEDYRWGNFYAVSGAWRISSEPFFDVAFIDDLKLRGGWGEAGNDQAAVGSYSYLSTVNGGLSSYRWGSGDGDPIGTIQLGSTVDDLPTPNLSWEVATTTSAAVDVLLFNNRLDLTVEWYQRITDGILQTVDLNPSVGVNNPLQNIGEMKNDGVDIQLGFNNQVGDFFYDVSGNISFIQNEVTKLYKGQPLLIEGLFERDDAARIEEGRSVGVIWGYKVGGIFQTQQEIDEYFSNYTDANVSNADYVEPGDMYFQDVHGNPTDEEPFYSKTPDGAINEFDRTEIGNTIPGYTYGINLSVGWKNLSLSMGFYGEGDVDKYNSAKQTFESMAGGGPNYYASTLDRWTPSNTDTDIPRAVVGDPAGNNRFSDRWVESAAFFRLNNWQLSYSLPVSLLNKINNAVSSMRVYVGGQNNLYLNRWSTLDPVSDQIPLPRTYHFGIDFQF